MSNRNILHSNYKVQAKKWTRTFGEALGRCQRRQGHALVAKPPKGVISMEIAVVCAPRFGHKRALTAINCAWMQSMSIISLSSFSNWPHKFHYRSMASGLFRLALPFFSPIGSLGIASVRRACNRKRDGYAQIHFTDNRNRPPLHAYG